MYIASSWSHIWELGQWWGPVPVVHPMDVADCWNKGTTSNTTPLHPMKKKWKSMQKNKKMCKAWKICACVLCKHENQLQQAWKHSNPHLDHANRTTTDTCKQNVNFGHLIWRPSWKMAAILDFQLANRAELLSFTWRTSVPILMLVSSFARFLSKLLLSAPLVVLGR